MYECEKVFVRLLPSETCSTNSTLLNVFIEELAFFYSLASWNYFFIFLFKNNSSQPSCDIPGFYFYSCLMVITEELVMLYASFFSFFLLFIVESSFTESLKFDSSRSSIMMWIFSIFPLSMQIRALMSVSISKVLSDLEQPLMVLLMWE